MVSFHAGSVGPTRCLAVSTAGRHVAIFVATMAVLTSCQRLRYEDDEGAGLPDSDGGTDTDTPPDATDDGEPSGPPTSPVPVYDCDPSRVDACPSGQKCAPILLGSRRNHYVCVEDAGGLAPNDSCTAAPSTGRDGCPAGTACIVDDMDFGRCLELCRDSADCGFGECPEDVVDGVRYCAAPCDPFDPACGPGTSCRRGNESFICRLPLTIDTGLTGEPCDTQSDTGCAGGFVCLNGAVVPGCSAFACCSSICELSAPTCPSPTSCVPLFPTPGPEAEEIGACLIPP